MYAFWRILFGAFPDRLADKQFHISGVQSAHSFYSRLSTPCTGESFAGRYIPLFADYIAKKNDVVSVCTAPHRPWRPGLKLALRRSKEARIPLRSVLIGQPPRAIVQLLVQLTNVELSGNGNTNPLIQYQSYLPVACTNASGYGPYLGKETCDLMKDTLPRCIDLQQKCYDTGKASACLAANTYCEKSQVRGRRCVKGCDAY